MTRLGTVLPFTVKFLALLGATFNFKLLTFNLKHLVVTHPSEACGQKKQNYLISSAFSTEGRDRTGTSVTSSVFETDASTDSATSARYYDSGCKGKTFFVIRRFFAEIKLKKSFLK